MNDIAIRVESLSKEYHIGSNQNGHFRYKSLRDTLAEAFISPFRRASSLLRGEAYGAAEMNETIWALKDVSFEVKRGEVVGIIGRNGAGKSTLLKILSRITEPTEGQAAIYGRVGSLLEVGTGFHPELTGRENIYLNGAILGMRRAEIERKFDEIVAFAEVEKFIDTPVKHYSSGMYLRLAFAVAAHLEPEILLVDEVLAVGDAGFQKKCLGKMGDVAKAGRTVLFVSHNMAAIGALCHSGIYLDEGGVKYRGDVNRTVSAYLNSNQTEAIPSVELKEDPHLLVQILAVRVVNKDHELAQWHPYDEPFWLKIELLVRETTSNIYLAAHIHDQNLETLIFSRDFESDVNHLLQREAGRYTYLVKIPSFLLVPGHYSVTVHIARSTPAQVISGVNYVCPFEIVDNGSVRAKMGFPWRGKIATPLKWEYVR